MDKQQNLEGILESALPNTLLIPDVSISKSINLRHKKIAIELSSPVMEATYEKMLRDGFDNLQPIREKDKFVETVKTTKDIEMVIGSDYTINGFNDLRETANNIPFLTVCKNYDENLVNQGVYDILEEDNLASDHGYELELLKKVQTAVVAKLKIDKVLDEYPELETYNLNHLVQNEKWYIGEGYGSTKPKKIVSFLEAKRILLHKWYNEKKNTENPKINVLVVDDEETVLDLLEDRLKRQKYNVKKCSNYKDALQIFNSSNIDIVITDLILPSAMCDEGKSENGLNLIRDIRKSSAYVPIIASTASDDSKLVADAINNGAFKLLSKPLASSVSEHSLENLMIEATKELKKQKKTVYEEIFREDRITESQATRLSGILQEGYSIFTNPLLIERIKTAHAEMKSRSDFASAAAEVLRNYRSLVGRICYLDLGDNKLKDKVLHYNNEFKETPIRICREDEVLQSLSSDQYVAVIMENRQIYDEIEKRTKTGEITYKGSVRSVLEEAVRVKTGEPSKVVREINDALKDSSNIARLNPLILAIYLNRGEYAGLRPFVITRSKGAIIQVRYQGVEGEQAFIKYFKPEQQQLLRNEEENIAHFTNLNRELGKDYFRIVKKKFSDRGAGIITFEMIPGPTLYKKSKSEKGETLVKSFEEAVTQLARFHAFGAYKRQDQLEDSITQDIFTDHKNEQIPNKANGSSIFFLNRLDDVFFNQIKDYSSINISPEERDGILSSYWPINNRLSRAERVFYVDGSSRNWIEKEGNGIVAFDFTDKCIRPPQLDLSSLLEFTDAFTREESETLIKLYLVEYRRAKLRHELSLNKDIRKTKKRIKEIDRLFEDAQDSSIDIIQQPAIFDSIVSKKRWDKFLINYRLASVHKNLEWAGHKTQFSYKALKEKENLEANAVLNVFRPQLAQELQIEYVNNTLERNTHISQAINSLDILLKERAKLLLPIEIESLSSLQYNLYKMNDAYFRNIH